MNSYFSEDRVEYFLLKALKAAKQTSGEAPLIQRIQSAIDYRRAYWRVMMRKYDTTLSPCAEEQSSQGDTLKVWEIKKTNWTDSWDIQ